MFVYIRMSRVAFGAHASVSNGVFRAIDDVLRYGGNLVQIFVGNPRGRSSAKSTAAYIAQAPSVREYCKLTEASIVVHAPYIVNLAEPLGDGDGWWLDLVWRDLTVADAFGAIGVVVHVGKHKDKPAAQGLANMADNLRHLLERMRRSAMRTKLILETSAGQGTELLATADNSVHALAEFYNQFSQEDKAMLKLCVDSCHVFAAGYDLRTAACVDAFVRDLDTRIGLQHVALLHLNDSKRELGSRVDKHAQLGQGCIGLEGLMRLVVAFASRGIPMVLETGGDLQQELGLISLALAHVVSE